MNYAFTLDTATYIPLIVLLFFLQLKHQGKSERENDYVFMKSLNQYL